MARRRPNPIQWLWYAAGGALPAEYREWVLHDVTSKHYLWRHAARSTVLVAPLAAVWLLLPGPLVLRLMLCLLAVLVGYFYSFAYADENCEHRIAKHGYEYGTARAIREAARAETDSEMRDRYNALYRRGAE
ncbi:DUF5313 family protein [Saccharomonospora viridis]|jgi:hypothetical protein|uniref:DUF5313 domain-containing protein n=2 Tax=Saccharomonospora viridis TaxID=1852 RepID=C7MW44_SACVD|nr:DUF5313 family protein [Saccharomonospora viridis]ACU97813.1 hypothetical protein Svir_28320 [Saccharomonospora viridis DSM 43017]KHF45774.1 hypothetical protein MINT15_00750 [Saccharomonospora viridis]